MKNLKITTLDSGYCDKDKIMLHACFQILVNFVKQEWDNGCGWRAETFGGQHDIDVLTKDLTAKGYKKKDIKWEVEFCKRSNEINKEIWDLHAWWTKTRPTRDPNKCADWNTKKHGFVDDVEDCEMLDRLIKVRCYLWT